MLAVGSPRHFVVAGAGIVGICCALHLRLAGHRVTLLDPAPPGQGCSRGNGGLLQVGGCIPLGTPAVLRQLPRMLVAPLSPMRIRWADLPWLAPFLVRFVVASRPARFERIADALAALLRHAWEGYVPLLRQGEAGGLVRRAGELYVYESGAAFESARPYHDMRRTRGVALRYLDGAGARDIEPALGPSVRHAAWLEETWAVGDPLVFAQRLAAAFLTAGGRLVQQPATALETNAGRVTAVRLPDGALACDGVVIAAGHASGGLIAPLGLRVPLRAERGHHLMLPRPGVELRTALVSGDHRFGLIPMAHGLRLVGSSELVRPHRPPDFTRIERLLAPATRLLPGLASEGATRWHGARPSMPDSLPVIGTCAHAHNVLLAFGHGHLGMTLAGITGQLVAQLAGGERPSVDLAPFQWPRQPASAPAAPATKGVTT